MKKTKINQKSSKSLRILQFNAVSLKARSLLLGRVLHQNKIDVCCVQEAKIFQGKRKGTCQPNISIRGYKIIPCDCKNHPHINANSQCRGLALLGKTKIKARLTEVKNHTFMGGTHCQGIEIAKNDDVFKIVNIYANPRAKIHYDSNELWGNQEPSKTILAGDFNAKCK